MNKNQLLTLEAYSDSGARRTRRPLWSGPFVPTGSFIQEGHLSVVVEIQKPESVVRGYKWVREPSSLAEQGRTPQSFTPWLFWHMPVVSAWSCQAQLLLPSTLREFQEAALHGRNQWCPCWALWLMRLSRRRLELCPQFPPWAAVSCLCGQPCLTAALACPRFWYHVPASGAEYNIA